MFLLKQESEPVNLPLMEHCYHTERGLLYAHGVLWDQLYSTKYKPTDHWHPQDECCADRLEKDDELAHMIAARGVLLLGKMHKIWLGNTKENKMHPPVFISQAKFHNARYATHCSIHPACLLRSSAQLSASISRS